MITAEDLFKQANISPTDFGVDIVPPGTEDELARVFAIEHIDELILPGAVGDVSVPFAQAANGYDLPLPLEVVMARYPRFTQNNVDAYNDQLQALYDAAVVSYARSEINKQVASNSGTYDQDADQDRKIGDQKLAKLIESVSDIVRYFEIGPGVGTKNRRAMPSMSVSTGFTF